MVYKAYLKADGISGGSTEAGHGGEIDLLSYSFGSQLSAAGGHGSGKVDFQ